MYIIICKGWYDHTTETLNADGEWCDLTDRPMTFATKDEAQEYINHNIMPKYPNANCDFIAEKEE